MRAARATRGEAGMGGEILEGEGERRDLGVVWLLGGLRWRMVYE